LTSGRDLLRIQAPRTGRSEPVVIADPYFGEPEIELAKFSNGAAGKPRSTTTGPDLSTNYFAPLGGTAQEAQAIKSRFPQARLLTGRQATKSALKQLEAPSILHIATHGFFLHDAGGASP